MTNAWGSIDTGCAGVDAINHIKDTPWDQGMTLEAFKECLPCICKDLATIHGSDSYNYGVCTVATNLYNIFDIILKAVKGSPKI
jgi:hypothetical protein